MSKKVIKPWEDEAGATSVDGFLEAFSKDDNTFWRMESGHAKNVIEELIERIQSITAERDAEVKRAREASQERNAFQNQCISLKRQVFELKGRVELLEKKIPYTGDYKDIDLPPDNDIGTPQECLRCKEQSALLHELAGACEAITSYWEHGKLTVNGDYANGCARKALTKYNSWKGSKG